MSNFHATFACCVALNWMWLPPQLTQIGKEVFLNCVALQEVPTELCDTGIRAFCGCEQLQRFTPFVFHEYGRRVGMVPRSSLKGGKNSLMVEKRTRTPNTTQTKQPKAHRQSLHHHVVFPLC